MPIDPLATNQVEVIRGPAAMRYGSTSIGGVVSATNNRIPEALPTCPAAPFQSYGLPAKAPLANAQSSSCVTVETRTAVSSVDRGVEGGILLDAGGGNFAVHADAYGRKASDYSIPGYPYLFDQTRPVNGRQPNSADAGGRRVGRRLLHLPWRLHRRRDHAERHALSHPRHRRRRSPDPDRRRTRPNSPPRANTGRTRRRSTPSGSGPAPPTTAQRDRPRRSRRPVDRRRAADIYQQGAGRPRRGADDAVQRALCRGHDGLRPAGQAIRN